MRRNDTERLFLFALTLMALPITVLHSRAVPPLAPFEFSGIEEHQVGRWTEQKAWDWYRNAGPIVGCNYLPRTAVNMTEMWQKETFDPKTIDEELGWAHEAGYTSIRVFIQYLVWKHDPEGLNKRLDTFLTIAEKYRLGVMLVPFCDCAFSGREPYLGKQDDPKPGVPNSRWVPSPGLKRVVEPQAWPDLEKYIKDLVGHFGNDRRVLIWDLYNEPGQAGLGEQSMPLVAAAFRWAREMKPTQPLTAGVWTHFKNRMSIAQFELSDIISFHTYLKRDQILEQIALCKQFGRPMVCTEWLMRQHANTFDTVLPLFTENQIGSYHWGLVAGRTQTYMHWESKPGDPMPKVWQHDMFYADGRRFDAREFVLLADYRDALRGQLRGGGPKSVVESATYRGWKDYLMKNDFVRLNVVPAAGGRVMQFALGDKEFLWVNPDLEGKTSPETGLDPDGEWMNYGGDKLWPAPQGWDNDQQWPGPPDAVLDGQPHRAEVDKDSAMIRLTSRDDPRSGIRFIRSIRLDPNSTRVSFKATMTNVDTKPRRWGIWAHTQLDAGLPGSKEYNKLMRAWCPVNPRSRFKGGFNVIFGEKDHPSFSVDEKRGLVKVDYLYKVGKIGVDSHAGWVATVDGRRGDVFVQRFTFESDKAYPDESSVEFWHNGVGRIYAYNKWLEMGETPAENPYVFESEILSPFAQLQPGERCTWAYDWYACRIGGDHPVVDCNDTAVVSAPLTIQRDGRGLRVTGRFGVFSRGRMGLEITDAESRVLQTRSLDQDVTPLVAIVLDEPIKLPASAARIALVLHAPTGSRIGPIASAQIPSGKK